MGESLLMSHGAGGGIKYKAITQAEYDALSTSEKTNPRKAYIITNSQNLIGDQEIVEQVLNHTELLYRIYTEIMGGTTTVSGSTITKKFTDGYKLVTTTSGSTTTEILYTSRDEVVYTKKTTTGSDGSKTEVYS